MGDTSVNHQSDTVTKPFGFLYVVSGQVYRHVAFVQLDEQLAYLAGAGHVDAVVGSSNNRTRGLCMIPAAIGRLRFMPFE